MIIQYPHYLFAVKSDTNSVQDEDGNWNESPAKNTFISVCREETNGRGAEIQVAGGTFFRFASLIQLPKGARMVNEGTSIFVSDKKDGKCIRVKGVVLKSDLGQLHSRIWI